MKREATPAELQAMIEKSKRRRAESAAGIHIVAVMATDADRDALATMIAEERERQRLVKKVDP